jgi:hypothetical protein
MVRYKHLADIDRHIAGREVRIACQSERVAELGRDGRDASDARDLLRLMQEHLRLVLEYRALLLRSQ